MQMESAHTGIEIRGIGKRYRLGKMPGALELAKRGVRKAINRPAPEKAGESFWALKDISLDVPRGQALGIVGKNGAGKSTLLKILSRVTLPTEGEARLRGRVTSLLEIGTGFHPELSGRENIFMNGSILGMRRSEIKARFDEIVAFADIGKFLDTPVKRYSSGMYVRLAFAVAAHLRSEILLIDEVLAVGDAAFQKKCLGKTNDIVEGGRTVIFVSHSMASIRKLCDRAILIEQGKLTMDDTPERVISTYLGRQEHVRAGALAYEVRQSIIDRFQTDDFQIPKVELLTLEGAPLTKIETGDGMIVRMHFACQREIPAPSFSVQVSSHHGQELIRLNTAPISGYEIDHLPARGSVDLRIDSLPLNGGRYYLTMGCARERTDWIVRLPNVMFLDITPTDVYDSGLLLDDSRGLLALSHAWDLRETPPESDAGEATGSAAGSATGSASSPAPIGNDA